MDSSNNGPELKELQSQIFRTIDTMPVDMTFSDKEFSKAFVSLAQYQATHNAAYKRYLDSRDAKPKEWKAWQNVDPMPVSLYKSWDVSLPGTNKRVWHSSGTTGQVSKTGLGDLLLYDLVIDKEKDYFLPFPPTANVLILLPAQDVWDHSSLAYMFDRLALGKPSYHAVQNVKGDSFDFDFGVAVDYLTSFEGLEPVVILSTSYGMVQFYDYIRNRGIKFELTEDSCLVHTGGFKGKARTLDRFEMDCLAWDLLGLAPSQIVCEYGMSELASQFWEISYRKRMVDGIAASSFYMTPPWMRVRTIDPMTGLDDPEGVIAVYDLASFWTCGAIMTQDIGDVAMPFVEVYGRAKGATEKGCSLTVERALREKAP